MGELEEKIEYSKSIIKTISKHFYNPIISCGFGKDSLPVLHLTRTMGFDWPILFYKEPFFPKKLIFANKVISDWDLVCYDYPPETVSLFYHNGVFEIARQYRIGAGVLSFCALLYEPKDLKREKYLCGYKDIALQPTGSFGFRWDLLLQGFRYTEKKPHAGYKQARLRWYLRNTPGCPSSVQPCRDWTDQDVCEYTLKYNVPWNKDVYYIDNGEFLPLDDPTYNPDRRPACVRCLIPDGKVSVHCPKLNMTINNVSGSFKMAILPNDFPTPEEEE